MEIDLSNLRAHPLVKTVAHGEFDHRAARGVGVELTNGLRFAVRAGSYEQALAGIKDWLKEQEDRR